ncbi:TetR/AcrR family transcriptional regulator [Allobranchiibius sp. GilTou73]|uniref:TetR/AcrR family transcriptional regulator n=1 Tax=Allobranchiibius sp. GilTou73 TaxID=2904523 RepID=UPI001F209DEE|nr:TetR family transcriptional regulator [Allobranchiibius sp. GilTou73]UIJ35597.1 TetR family transcriptional regulator [Allobranchiibius sp. GilTou73]
MARTRPYRAQTRRKVLDAAYVVFGERGIAGTSLEQVAAAAGLTKGAVYSNFRSKDELVLTLMEEHAADRITKSLQAMEVDLTPSQVAHQVGVVLAQEMRADAGWHRLLAEYAALTRRDPAGAEGLRQGRREVRDAVAGVLDRLVETFGVTLPMPSADLAIVVLALGNGLALETEIEPDGVRDDLFAQVLGIIASDVVTVVADTAADAQDVPVG